MWKERQTIRLANRATWLWLVVALFLSLPVSVKAQSNYTPSELDTLVSNIALYPDPLLVHVLTASTYGDQIPAANAWAQGHKHLKGESLSTAMENDNLTYDPSVQALIPFPSVLEMMAKYRSWTDQLGDAVSAQKDDVMDAIQRLRQSAQEHGHLSSNDKVKVERTEKNIVIIPVRTEYVYVPVYNPRVVYYTYADGYTRVTYSSGVWLGTWFGEWGWGTCYFDWGPRIIYVRNTRWYAHRPIPHHPRRYRPPHHHYGHPAPPPHHGPKPAHHVNAVPAQREVPTQTHRVVPIPTQKTATAPSRNASAAPAPRQEVFHPVSHQGQSHQQVIINKPGEQNSFGNVRTTSSQQQNTTTYGNVQSTQSRGNVSSSRSWDDSNYGNSRSTSRGGNSGNSRNSNSRNGGFGGAIRR